MPNNGGGGGEVHHTTHHTAKMRALCMHTHVPHRGHGSKGLPIAGKGDCFSHFSFSTTKRKCNQLILSCGNAHAQPSAVHFPQPIVRRPRPGRYRSLVLARHFSFWPQRCLGSPQHVMAAPSSTATFCSTNGTCAPLRMRSGNSYETAQYEVVGALGGTDPGPVPM